MHAAEAYGALFEFDKPYTHQMHLFEAAQADRFPLLLRAPCGTGKTEAAVAPWLAQFLENRFFLPPRLIYVLPTQALCNDIHSRLENWAARANKRLVVSVQHGAAPNDNMLLSDIAVTTLDHFIYAYARSSGQVHSHIDLPAGCIAHSLVVFDEAHLYQSPYTFSIMRAMLEILHAARVPFIVMTATMPRSLQESFSEHIEFTEVGYGGELADRELKLELRLERPLLRDNMLDAEALQAIGEARRTLIVCNTVATAQEVYRLLEGPARDDVVLIHSRYTVADRDRHEEHARKVLENAGVVVSTQVCEAGLDISVDLLITEMAPADSLVQRAGRCARLHHGEAPYRGTVMIYCPMGHPYELEHITATCRYLSECAHLNLAEWEETCHFADAMPYVADDIAARDSLFDLYEATLYADHRPWELAVREGKYLYGWAGDFERLSELDPSQANEYFRRHQITLAWETALGMGYRKPSGDSPEHKGIFARKGGKYQQIRYSSNDQCWERHELGNLLPMSTYLLRAECYDEDLGVIPGDE